MDERRIRLVVGALLHDIGKVLYRYNDGRNHSISGYEYLKDELGICDNDVLEQVKFHHSSLLKRAELKEDSLAYITYIADNIASATDRRKNEKEEPGFNREQALESIFNLLNNNNAKKVYHASQLDEKINYPVENPDGFNENFYGKIISHLQENLLGMSYTAEYLNSLLEVLEAELSYIPSSTMKSEVADISLYDHVKLTAAFAVCIMSWLEFHDVENFKEELLKNAEQFYSKPVFLLFSMDMSGIQDFIYTIASKDALKSLRSRSFYLEILMENFVDELVEKVNVCRANLLYSGGGHAYLILPNTDEVKAKLEEFEVECNEWLLQEFNTDLYLACAYQECSTLELHNEPEGSYRAIFKEVSAGLGKRKVQRYSAEQLIKINSKNMESETRECKICRASDKLTPNDVCKTCDALIKMSNSILYKGFYAVTTREDIEPSLPLPYGKYLIAQSEKALLEKMKREELLRIYTKNTPYTGLNVAKRLWVGDYTAGETFEELAIGAQGIKRIAVLRADVDELGNAFVNGFASEKFGERYMTISRTATFSRKMSMFFKYHINSLLKNGQCYIGDKKENGEREITIVYSGGDDLFIVGSWDEIIGFAIDLRKSFKDFSQDTLSISAGIGIYPGKYPISTMARKTGNLESAAKKYPGKNAVTLFEADLTFSWDDFEENIVGKKLVFLKTFFTKIPEKGKAFLYRILELIRNMEQDKINLARLAYLLARLEESVKNKEKDEEVLDIQNFSKEIYGWIKNPMERKEFVAAIYLYVYLLREKEE